ncbi:MAG: DUF6159 family protein [Saprospiraceae bacterium]|nr:hypothetical protein [Saprospiraceae bacterium]MCB9343117.1 hypothetical protein [Lewinellaceae bacterium]
MSFFSRLSNGWELAKVSFSTINKNRSLLLFPVFSTISLLLILASFAGGTFFFIGGDLSNLENFENENVNVTVNAVIVFLYYLINYFIIVFFNSALIFCAVKILNGEETRLSEGIQFANDRIGKIFGWAVLSATVGTLLRFIQNAGKAGEIISSIFGVAWSILTFFAVPILVFEDKGVIDTVKESGRLMKQKWGESLAANVSFGIFHFLGILLAIAIGILLMPIHPVLGILLGVLAVLLVSTIVATAETVFIAAVYNHIKGAPTGEFDGDVLDSAFITK